MAGTSIAGTSGISTRPSGISIAGTAACSPGSCTGVLATIRSQFVTETGTGVSSAGTDTVGVEIVGVSPSGIPGVSMVVSGTSTSVSGTSVDGAGVEAGSGTSTSVSGTSVDGAGVEAGSGSSSNSLSMSSSSSSSSSFLRTASRFLPISVSLHRGILIFGASILSALRLMCPIVGREIPTFPVTLLIA